jgi:hypothetical protein
MFSTARATWLTASWRKCTSDSVYWSAAVLATASAPMLRPRTMRGTMT